MDLDNYNSYEKPHAGRRLSTSSWDADRPHYLAPQAIMAPQQKKRQLQSPKPPRRQKGRKGSKAKSSSSTSRTSVSSSSTSDSSTTSSSDSSSDSSSSDSDSDDTTTTSSSDATSTTSSSDSTFSSRSSSTSSATERRRKRRARRQPSLAASEKLAAAAACEALLLKERELKRLEYQLADEKRNFTRDVKRRASQQQAFDTEDEALSQMQRLIAMEGEDKIDNYVRGPTDATPRLQDKPESSITRGMNRVSAFQEGAQQKDLRQVVLDDSAPKRYRAQLLQSSLQPHAGSPAAAGRQRLESTTPPLAASEEDNESATQTNEVSPSVTGSMTPPTHAIDPIAKITGQQNRTGSPMPSEIPSASVPSVCSGPPAMVSIHRGSIRNDAEELQDMIITASTTRRPSNSALSLVPRKKNAKVKVKRSKRKDPTNATLLPPPLPSPPHRTIISPPIENSNVDLLQPNYNSTAPLQSDPRWQEQMAQQQLQQLQQQVQQQQQQLQQQQLQIQQQQPPQQTIQQPQVQKGLQPWSTMPPDWPCASPVKASRAPVPPQTLWQATSAMGPLSSQEFKSLLCSEYVPPSTAASPSATLLAGDNSTALQPNSYNNNINNVYNNNNSSTVVNGTGMLQQRQQQQPLNADSYKTPSQQRMPTADGRVGQPAPPDGRSLYEPFNEACRQPPAVKTERFVEVTDSEQDEPTPSPPPPPVAVDEDGSVMEFPPPPRLGAPDMPPYAPAHPTKVKEDGCCGNGCGGCGGCGDGACSCCCPCFLRCFFCCCRKNKKEKEPVHRVQPLEPVLLASGAGHTSTAPPPQQLPVPPAVPSEATLDGANNNNNNNVAQRNPQRNALYS